MFALINRIVISTALSLALLACGSAQDQNGASVSNTAMTVSSAPSGEILVASSTDSAGRFEMTLPSSETSLDISLEGTTPVAVQRSISESSAVFASVAVDSSSNQSSLASQVEARIVGSSCPDLTFTPLSVDATAVADVSSACEVQVEVSTSDVNTATSAVVVSGQCDSRASRSDFSIVEVSGHDTISVDIAPALRSNCEMLLIEVRSNGDRREAIQFELAR
jgi:hypothetical protein